MQRYINFIFFEVWCKARKGYDFNLDLFDGNPDLKEVMTTFHYAETDAAYFFSGHIERIFGLFSKLTRTEIKQFKRWHQGNNNIQKVCANDPAVHLGRYEDIPIKHQLLIDQLDSFFKGIYDRIDNAPLKKKIGHIDDHYDAFMLVNRIGKCPFCGISDMLSEKNTKREAYDHYLPKHLYPFNSINFLNLAPACHHCNSNYKTTNDPVYSRKTRTQPIIRRKAFYPYSKSQYKIEIKVKLNSPNVSTLQKNQIDIEFGPAQMEEEIKTWKDVYGIEERYKAKICGESDGKEWFLQVMDEWKELGRTPSEFMKALNLRTTRSPFTDDNFLKKPFLDACQEKGLLA